MGPFVYFLIPIAIAATAIVLGIGLFAFFKGGAFNAKYSNKLMQYRILFQFVAIMLIMAGIAISQS